MEQQEILEHPETNEPEDTEALSITPCPQSLEDGSKLILGRYASVEHLESAYEKLQSEFTRKAQRLAELEQQLGSKQDTASVASENLVNARPEKTAETQQQIIQDYLASVAIKRQPPAVITTSHDFAFTHKSGYRSIRDVSRIAEDYFKSKGVNYDNNPVS